MNLKLLLEITVGTNGRQQKFIQLPQG